MPKLSGGIWLAIALSGCWNDEPVDVFTAEEFAIIETLGPLADPPASPTNKFADSAAAAAFGQQLFFDKSYSCGPAVMGQKPCGAPDGPAVLTGAAAVSCPTCHTVSAFYTDTRSNNATSLGAAFTARNAPSLVNVVYYEWGSWSGKDDSFWFQGTTGLEAPPIFGTSTRLLYAHMLQRKYLAEYNAVFAATPIDPALTDLARFPAAGKPKANAMAPDGAWEGMAAGDQRIVNEIVANAGKALEAYERTLISRNAPLDRYIAGDHGALTEEQKNGLRLFIGKAACIDCHRGPTLSDQDFHNTGVAQVGGTVPRADTGRFDDLTRALTNPFLGTGMFSDDAAAGAAKLEGISATEDLKGTFRTPSLRHVANTAPYMHTGALATLEDVVRFYNVGGGDSGIGTKHPALVQLFLTDDEEADLVAFLHALTGEPVPVERTVDTSKPEPP
jgi:cytochrome c peroxidase